MKLFLKENYQPFLLVVAMLATSTIFFYETYLASQLFPTGELPYKLQKKLASLMILTLLTLAGSIMWSAHRRMKRLESAQNWLINAVNWNIERLKIQGLGKLAENQEGSNVSENASRWPWGSHHTEYLGHLDAAARKWWNLYDPTDPTTAPTNDIVSDWLQSERKLSREKARAIASMLRPDGLPTGPRR